MRYRKLSRSEVLRILRQKDRIIKKLYREKQELKHYASFDSMTHALNRGIGINILKKKMIKAKITGDKLTVCFIDVDELKKINDNFGHSEGDRLLINIVKIIKGNIRKNDFIIRLGGDEFLIVFPQTDIKCARGILKRICDKITKINSKGTNNYKMSISYGFAQFNPNSQLNVKKLIDKADEEMYKKSKKIKDFKHKCQNKTIL